MGDYPLAHPGAYRRIYQDISGSANIVAATDWSTAHTLVALKSKYTIYVQKITVQITTDGAHTLTFQDSATTPIVIAKTKSAPGLGPIVFDFGEQGVPLTESKAFSCLMDAAGLAGEIHWEGYLKPSATAIVPSEI